MLRSDRIGRRERTKLIGLLESDRAPHRRRCIEILRNRAVAEQYRTVAQAERGTCERKLLVASFRQVLDPAASQVDRDIDYVIKLADGYEQVAGYLESVFRGLCRALSRRGASAPEAALLADPDLKARLQKARTALARSTSEYKRKLDDVAGYPDVRHLGERLHQLLLDAQAGLLGEHELVESTLARHYRVQQQKEKARWIERDERHWTLMPGFGDVQEEFWEYDGASFLHPFRLVNAYSLLVDLRQVPAVEDSDAEET